MTDDLDHDAAEELLRKVERRDSQTEARRAASRPPLTLPPMDMSFRRKKNDEDTGESQGTSTTGSPDQDEEVSTTFGPSPWSKSDPEADTDLPDHPGGIEPLDKPGTGMGDFDVVMERHGLIGTLRKRPALLLGAIPVLAAVVVVGAVVVVSLGGSDTSKETSPLPEPFTAASIQTHSPGTYVPPAPNGGGDSGTSLEVWGEPSWKTAPEKLFTWYGDGLSEVAATFRPIIGTSDFRYFWKVDNATTTDQAIHQIEQAVTAETLGDVVVFAYGNNEDVTAVQMENLRKAVGDRGLVLVGTGASDPRALPWSPQLNGRFQKLAAERPDTYYVDWQSRVTANPNLVERGFVLTPEGSREWVSLINSTVLQAYR